MTTQDTPQQAPNHSLSGHQIQAIRQQMLNEFQRALDDVELRKIALGHACEVARASMASIPVVFDDVVRLARGMHKFLSEGAAGLAGK